MRTRKPNGSKKADRKVKKAHKGCVRPFSTRQSLIAAGHLVPAGGLT